MLDSIMVRKMSHQERVDFIMEISENFPDADISEAPTWIAEQKGGIGYGMSKEEALAELQG